MGDKHSRQRQPKSEGFLQEKAPRVVWDFTVQPLEPLLEARRTIGRLLSLRGIQRPALELIPS